MTPLPNKGNNTPRNNNKKGDDQHRINEEIKAPMVRLVGEGIETNIYPVREALKIAESLGLDLVEISPDSNPPVCKAMDYKKFVFDQKKKQKEIKQNASKTVVKEIRLGPQTDDHDFEFKTNHAIRFLKEGSKVKVGVFFKGRSIVYKDQGELILLKFAQAVEEFGKPEQMPKLEGKRMFIVINPIKK